MAALLALAGCNREGVADVTLDADAAQRNATAAKTRDDLAAADAAIRGPAPVYAVPARPAAAEPAAPADPADDQTSEPTEPAFINGQ
jgi:hypothetical protein